MFRGAWMFFYELLRVNIQTQHTIRKKNKMLIFLSDNLNTRLNCTILCNYFRPHWSNSWNIHTGWITQSLNWLKSWNGGTSDWFLECELVLRQDPPDWGYNTEFSKARSNLTESILLGIESFTELIDAGVIFPLHGDVSKQKSPCPK